MHNIIDCHFSPLEKISDYYFIATEQTCIPQQLVRIIGNKTLIEKRLEFEDLLKSSDAVVTKPGYGIVADCIANEVPILYARRSNFKEYDVLVRGIKKFVNSVYIPNKDLMKCKLEKYLLNIFENPERFPKPEVNGDEIIAEFLVKN